MEELIDFGKERNLNQTEAGKLLGITQGQVGHIENGRRRPGMAVIRRLNELDPMRFPLEKLIQHESNSTQPKPKAKRPQQKQ